MTGAQGQLLQGKLQDPLTLFTDRIRKASWDTTVVCVTSGDQRGEGPPSQSNQEFPSQLWASPAPSLISGHLAWVGDLGPGSAHCMLSPRRSVDTFIDFWEKPSSVSIITISLDRINSQGTGRQRSLVDDGKLSAQPGSHALMPQVSPQAVSWRRH